MENKNKKVSLVVKKYTQLRAKKAQLQEELKKKLAPIDKKMLDIENVLHKMFLELGVTSMKTESGTPYLSEQSTVVITDRKELDNFVKKNNAFDLYQNRVTKDVYMNFREDGIEIPGTRLEVAKKVKIRS